MDIEELKAMIPSETVRNYVLETGWTFTDKEKAALLYHNDRLLREQQSYLRDLGSKTTDEELKEQIMSHLRWEEQALQAFKENKDRRCIYILKVREDSGYWDGEYLPCGYFFNWETAFMFGCREKSLFQIEKYLVDEVNESNDGTCYHDCITATPVMLAIPVAIGTRFRRCLALPCMDWTVELVFRKCTRGFSTCKPTVSQMTPLLLDDTFALFSVVIPSSTHNVEYAPLLH